MATDRQTATEELILSTPHKQPPTPPNPGVRPEWRDVMIAKLAERLASTGWQIRVNVVRDEFAEHPASRRLWTAVAEAAVDELIDRPEREFRAQLAAVVARNEEADSVGSWVPVTAERWL